SQEFVCASSVCDLVLRLGLSLVHRGRVWDVWPGCDVDVSGICPPRIDHSEEHHSAEHYGHFDYEYHFFEEHRSAEHYGHYDYECRSSDYCSSYYCSYYCFSYYRFSYYCS
ncbi:unnamed protein product, partial [Polarella glacialis]